MDRYKIVTKRNAKEQIIGYAVIDNATGKQVKSWSSRSGEGEGVTRKRRLQNARKRAEDYVASKLAALPLEEQRIEDVSGGDVTFDQNTGLYYTSDGKAYEDKTDALTAATELERVTGLEEDVAKFEKRIESAGALREGQAERVSARQQGQLMSNLRRAILGTGGEAGTVEALVPQITEQSERSLQDLIAQSRGRTQEQLAQFVPTEISAEFNQQRLADAMTQFLMQESTERAKFQATLEAQPEWWESVIGQFGQGVGTGVGMAVASGSDIRIKENISRVGKLDNGLPVYLFNYKGSDISQIGLMAQDVEKVNQEAVIEINGIKHVYYGKAVK